MEMIAIRHAQVLHSLPGRLRLHLPGWSGSDACAVEARFRDIPGVRRAEVSPLTRNVLVLYDPDLTHPERFLAGAGTPAARAPAEPAPPPRAADRGVGGGLMEALRSVLELLRAPATASNSAAHWLV